jgi:hypothetical protein
MKRLEADEISLVSGGEIEVVYGESSWLSDVANAVRDFFGGSTATSTPALNANLGIRG